MQGICNRPVPIVHALARMHTQSTRRTCLCSARVCRLQHPIPVPVHLLCVSSASPSIRRAACRSVVNVDMCARMRKPYSEHVCGLLSGCMTLSWFASGSTHLGLVTKHICGICLFQHGTLVTPMHEGAPLCGSCLLVAVARLSWYPMDIGHNIYMRSSASANDLP